MRAELLKKIEALLPPIETDSLDTFIEAAKHYQVGEIHADVVNRPINAMMARAGRTPGPYIWDDEYVTVYRGQAASGRRVEYVEHYGDDAIIKHDERYDPKTGERRKLITYQCLLSAQHRSLRMKSRGLRTPIAITEQGKELTPQLQQELDAAKKTHKLQPFLLT